jgi:hypothetical protein
MRPRQSFLAWPLLAQNQTSRSRRKGRDLTVEAEGRDALRPGSREPDPPCGRACLLVTDLSGMVALAACFTELLHKCRVVTSYAVFAVIFELLV